MASPLASLGILGTILAGAQLGYGAVKRALRVSSAIRDISPTQAVAGNIVSARCYVEESLVGKDETKKVMKGVMVMYCGQLTTLLENRQAMNQFQDVSDHMGSAMSRGAFEKYEDSFLSLEALEEKYPNQKEDGKDTDDEEDTTQQVHDLINELHPRPETQSTSFDGRVKEVGKGMLPVGQIIKVTSQVPKAGGGFTPLSLSLLVRIDPISVSALTMEKILDYGSPKLPKELTSVKRNVGEVKFWKDYTNKTKEGQFTKAFAEDKEQFREFIRNLKKQEGKLIANRADAVLSGSFAKMSANLANTILFVTEETIKKVKKELGYDFLKEDTRNKFFAKTFCMMIVVFDEYYHRVSIYMNGIDVVGHYTYNDFNSDKELDTNTLLSLFMGLGQNSIRQSRF